jgi:hypothetical protein
LNDIVKSPAFPNVTEASDPAKDLTAVTSKPSVVMIPGLRGGFSSNLLSQAPSKSSLRELLSSPALGSALGKSRSDPSTSGDQSRNTAIANALNIIGQEHPSIAGVVFQVDDRIAQRLSWLDNLVLILGPFLSPIGIVHLYREYFFRFGTMLGEAVGHVWLAPGTSLELYEVHTRKQLVEQTIEQQLQEILKTETTATTQDELSDAVKDANQQNTSFGAAVNGGVSVSIAHINASSSFNLADSRARSNETTHKQMRQQTQQASSEIQKSIKTTYKTSLETTDLSSKRYVFQNTTDQLQNYELRRKLELIGVEVQHIGSQLSWQVYVDQPGRWIGIGQLVHLAAPADLSKIPPPPDAPTKPPSKIVDYEFEFPYSPMGPDQDKGRDNEYHMNLVGPDSYTLTSGKTFGDSVLHGDPVITAPPPDNGDWIQRVDFKDYKGASGATFTLDHIEIVSVDGRFKVVPSLINWHDDNTPIMLTVTITWGVPDDPAADKKAADARANYQEQVARAQKQALVTAVKERVKLASAISPRNATDLRNEERTIVYRALIEQLTQTGPTANLHLESELIQSMFDVDQMLYFVAPDWWKPRASGGAVNWVKEQNVTTSDTNVVLTADNIVSWGGDSAATRPSYLITEDSQPAAFGASIGWVLQLDGDVYRNAFLNSPFIKAVVPITPGHERDALTWLMQAHVEGTGAGTLDAAYVSQPGDPPELQQQGLTVRDALYILADNISKLASVPRDQNDGTLATDTVFEHGFDPLAGGVKIDNTDPFVVFDRWIAILPTEQTVPVSVAYDPKTGLLL